MSDSWYAIDLDGTLAHFDEWKGVENIGEPIAPMVERVKKFIEEGKDVRIFTARASLPNKLEAIQHIDKWCKTHIGQTLPVTCVKKFGLVELWDDRAIQVIPNTGNRADGQ